MAYPAYLRERARQPRVSTKLSLDEIAERLALPKTTVYYWIKDLPLGRSRREPRFRDFVALYIAEGSKRNRNTVEIANSDPRVVAVAVSWMRRLAARPLGYSVQYHADQDLQEIRRFWGELLQIDGAAVTLQRKSNSSQLKGRTRRCKHGVLSVRVNDTSLRARPQAWIDRIRQDWALDSAIRRGA